MGGKEEGGVWDGRLPGCLTWMENELLLFEIGKENTILFSKLCIPEWGWGGVDRYELRYWRHKEVVQ